MIRLRLSPLLILLLALLLLSACNRVSRHKVVSTILDGTPSLPPAEKFCPELAPELPSPAPDKGAPTSAESGTNVTVRSSHLPFTEKRCNDCHDFDQPGGLNAAPDKLCFTCHAEIIQGEFAHGPAAVGDCLACHVPHTSPHESLLIVAREELCAWCHREVRQSRKMHDNVGARNMSCADCHDPHVGENNYFLK